MSSSKVNVEIDEVIKKLQRIQKSVELIKDEFCQECLIWIRDRANAILEEKTSFKETTSIRTSWEISQVESGLWTLRNTDEVGAYVEFGVGLKGEKSKHKQARKNAWIYDANSWGNKGWAWTREDLGITMYGFTGYKGKSFLYDAYFEFRQNKKYAEIFAMLLDRAIN